MAYPSKKDKRATKDDGSLQHDLGKRYEKNGDYDKAIYWYECAVDKMNTDAMCSLGLLYKDESAPWQSLEKAINYFQQAAKLGNKNGSYLLGLMYEFGDGVKKDAKIALKYYMDAQGHNKAEFRIGFIYDKGRGVKPSMMEAVKWYYVSSEHGNDDAYRRLKELEKQPVVTKNGILTARRDDEVNRGYISALLTLAKECKNSPAPWAESRALDYYKKASARGNAESAYELGLIYEGKNSPGALESALYWFRLAADRKLSKSWHHICNIIGNNWGKVDEKQLNQINVVECKRASDKGMHGATFLMGLLYEKGIIGEPDLSIAVDYYIKAAENNHVGAAIHVSSLYLNHIIHSDSDQLEKLVVIAADNGNADAQYHIAHSLYTSNQESQYGKMIDYYKKAARQKHMLSQYELGIIYLNDNCKTEAVKLLGAAALQGHEEAKRCADELYMQLAGRSIQLEEARSYYLATKNRAMVDVLSKQIEQERNKMKGGVGFRPDEFKPSDSN